MIFESDSSLVSRSILLLVATLFFCACARSDPNLLDNYENEIRVILLGENIDTIGKVESGVLVYPRQNSLAPESIEKLKIIWKEMEDRGLYGWYSFLLYEPKSDDLYLKVAALISPNLSWGLFSDEVTGGNGKNTVLNGYFSSEQVLAIVETFFRHPSPKE